MGGNMIENEEKIKKRKNIRTQQAAQIKTVDDLILSELP